MDEIRFSDDSDDEAAVSSAATSQSHVSAARSESGVSAAHSGNYDEPESTRETITEDEPRSLSSEDDDDDDDDVSRNVHAAASKQKLSPSADAPAVEQGDERRQHAVVHVTESDKVGEGMSAYTTYTVLVHVRLKLSRLCSIFFCPFHSSVPCLSDHYHFVSRLNCCIFVIVCRKQNESSPFTSATARLAL